LSPRTARAGHWFLQSGIQEPNGGVARYYRTDLERNQPLSTEITGYAASCLVYLHSVTGDHRYVEQAAAAARFLTRLAWDPEHRTMPFELGAPAYSYFFDCGIIVRGLLAVWRATGEQEFLDVAAATGLSMVRDFAAADDFHPILALPGLAPEPRDVLRWSRSFGCYQLKSAMAWSDLAMATGDSSFLISYERVREASLRTWREFLPGHPETCRVMDRLHAFLYFLEGLLPRAKDPSTVDALRDGIARAAGLLRSIAPDFARSDVYAQLLRIRIYAAWMSSVPLDTAAAAEEAEALAAFQATSEDPRIDGGYHFGRLAGEWLPYANPVSTAFSLQAMELWENRSCPPQLHLLI
jgi:hypothetical protein